MADADILRVVREHLEGYVLSGEQTPFFRKVTAGDPLILAPINRQAAFWVVGVEDPPEGQMTFGTWMRAHRLRVKAFWQHSPLEATRDAVELEVFTISHALPGVFYGDTTLEGNATRSLPENVIVETETWPPGADTMYRTVAFDLVVTVLEGETIAQ